MTTMPWSVSNARYLYWVPFGFPLSHALLAVISAETMTLHHSKHHNTYVTNLNATIEKIDSAMIAGDVSATIALQGALKFNGGGHVNHSLFWENLTPNSSGIKSGGALEAAINDRFGSVDAMISEMSASTVAVQGSGWGWLGYNTKSGKEARVLKNLPLTLLFRPRAQNSYFFCTSRIR
jgi:Fe-Mn family superoxide dismutase